eukprot:9566522-Karenia_brevis.AAC.1
MAADAEPACEQQLLSARVPSTRVSMPEVSRSRLLHPTILASALLKGLVCAVLSAKGCMGKHIHKVCACGMLVTTTQRGAALA